jgi:hypothetical protein
MMLAHLTVKSFADVSHKLAGGMAYSPSSMSNSFITGTEAAFNILTGAKG